MAFKEGEGENPSAKPLEGHLQFSEWKATATSCSPTKTHGKEFRMALHIAPRKALSRTTRHVGYGYDALRGDYVTPEGVLPSYPILDIGNNVKVMQQIISDTVVESGNSLHEVSMSVNTHFDASVGIAMFSGSVSNDFSYEKNTSDEYVFTKIMSIYVKERHYLEGDHLKLLHPVFIEDLEGSKLTPEQLFERYGTHLIKEIYVGGRIEANFSTKKSIQNSTTEIKNKLKASWGKAFETNMSADYKESMRKASENSEIKIKVIGGDSFTGTSLDNFSEAYKKWISSLNDKSKYEICHLPDRSRSFIPLWAMCKNSTRKQALENAFNALYAKVRNTLLEGEQYVIAYTFTKGKDADMAQKSCPPGYILCKKDLNADTKKSKDFYIYLCYKLGRKEEAYTHFCMERTTKKPGLKSGTYQHMHQGKSARYERNGTDLNDTAGGDYIYMSGTRDKVFEPVKRLCVVFKGEAYAEAEWTAVRWVGSNEAADCNKGAGGKFIYVMMKH